MSHFTILSLQSFNKNQQATETFLFSFNDFKFPTIRWKNSIAELPTSTKPDSSSFIKKNPTIQALPHDPFIKRN